MATVILTFFEFTTLLRIWRKHCILPRQKCIFKYVFIYNLIQNPRSRPPIYASSEHMKIQMFNKVGLKEWEGKVFIIQPLSILRKPGATRDGESLPWLLPPMLMITIIPFLLTGWRGSSGYRSRNFSLLQESPCSLSGLQIWRQRGDKMNWFPIYITPNIVGIDSTDMLG